MRVYGDTEALDPVLSGLAKVMSEKDQSIAISSYYEQPDIVIVNGMDEARHSKYAKILTQLNLKENGFVFLQIESGGKEVLLMAGYNLKSTQAGIQDLIQQVTVTGGYRNVAVLDKRLHRKIE